MEIKEYNNSTKLDSDILKIVKEDILRILGERDSRQAAIKVIKSAVEVSNLFIIKAIKELSDENLITAKQDFILLTEKGIKIAKNIVKKHLAVENYFKKFKSSQKAHQIAHILEHYISKEVIRNIKKLSTLKEKNIPLMQLELNQPALITNITFFDSKLFERVVSMGMSPGAKIVMVAKIPKAVIVKTRNKKFALDQSIAGAMRVLKI